MIWEQFIHLYFQMHTVKIQNDYGNQIILNFKYSNIVQRVNIKEGHIFNLQVKFIIDAELYLLTCTASA